MFDKKDLNNKIYVGVVENVYDKERKGRVQVRVQSLFNQIDLEHIPWADPHRSLDGKSFSVPSVGKVVSVIFQNGNIYEPQYIYAENNNPNLQQKLNEMEESEYENFVSILMDHKTQLYSDDTNLRLDYKFNQISLKNDGIDIHLKDNDQELHLGHNYADQSAVLGDAFFDWMDGFVQTLSIPTALVGNIKAPIIRPSIDLELKKYQALRQTFLSQHVKIVDNSLCLDTGEDRKNSPAQDDQTLLNNEHILESVLVDNSAKKDIKTRRKSDNLDNENSKPNPKDDTFSEERIEENTKAIEDLGDIDSPNLSDDNTPTKTISEDSLTEIEKRSIKQANEIDKRKSEPIKKKEVVEPDGDPYSDFWVGYKGRSSDSYQIEKIKNEEYGDYTSGSGSVKPKKYKGTAKKRKTKDGKTVINGKLDMGDLVKVDGFTVKVSGKYIEKSIYLERNAAIAWEKLNTDFKEKFNKPIGVNGEPESYRTYDFQLKYWNKYGAGNAARPGTSNHGWGVACDINYHGSGVLAWLEKNAPKYNIHKRVPHEDWHWVYMGETIYEEK